MRIAEVLMEGGEKEEKVERKIIKSAKRKEKKKQQGGSSFSPKRMLLLLFGWVLKKKKKKKKKGSSRSSCEEEEEHHQFTPHPQLYHHVSGEHAKRECVNLAVGFGLFYLISESQNELRKMIELRREMEMLLQSTKDNCPTKNKKMFNEPSESNTNRNCPNSDVHESLCFVGHFSIHNLSYENQTETLTSYSCEQSLTMNTDNNGKCAEEIDDLEAELENELKLLQVRMDTSNNPRNFRSKMDIDDSFSSSWESFVEAVDIEETDSREYFGVCPYELERKLHGLLHSRQQDKIEELEAALKRANQKLLEREREVSWWTDTAKIFSHHVPKASLLSRFGQSSHSVSNLDSVFKPKT